MKRTMLLLAVLLAACGGVTDPATTQTEPVEPGGATTLTSQDTDTTAATDTTTESTNSTSASSGDGDAVPAGQSGQVGAYEVSVLSWEDSTQAMAESDFNVPPPEGSAHILIRVAVTFLGNDSGEETSNPGLDLTWEGLGPSGVVATDQCGIYDEALFDIAEMTDGETREGNTCLTVADEDLAGLLLKVHDPYGSETVEEYFALP